MSTSASTEEAGGTGAVEGGVFCWVFGALLGCGRWSWGGSGGRNELFWVFGALLGVGGVVEGGISSFGCSVLFWVWAV